ncbi:fungal-specific transcription factor [Penicillium taxi]|uniref:fungal-specific transcription factor n=1 Tax=Penicillium taxi TaxID=168475 RepID=UPI002544F881|nr:fungal-specific transcription factor [Penicillium taxi]KAJ5908126.1 fungal-specific transcription factor [Penicillium taxi]
MDNRKRATRACDECRRLKEKCEGGVPCKRCSHFHRQCEFKGVMSRAREFRAYVPRERVDKPDIQELIARSKYMERILKRTVDGIRLDTKSLAQLADKLEADQGNGDLLEADLEDVEGLTIDDEAYTIDPVNDTTTHFSGEFSYWNFSMRVKQHIEEQVGGLENHNNDTNHTTDFPRAHQLRPGLRHLSAAIYCCPPQAIAEFLARTFFKYADMYYFFVEETWLFEKLKLLYSDPSRFIENKGEVTISIVLTILAIGSQYAHLESSGQDHKTASGSKTSEEDIGATFYEQAVRLLPEIIELSSLESVQACLLFGYYALPVDASGLGYIYINLTIRLGMQNGMHRRCKPDAFSPAMIESRNRVWWTAYLLERKISIFHGRPLSMLRSDMDANLPTYRADLGLSETRENIERTNVSIRLAHFLEDLFEKVTLLRSCEKTQVPKIVSKLLTSKADLTKWWNSLPEEITGGGSQHLLHARAAMHLQLEYCLVRMFIGRPFLLKKSTSDSENPSPRSESDHNEGASQRSVSGRKDLTDDCVQAATWALEICQKLRDKEPGLARASYIEYSACRASLLVLIAYSIQRFSEQFRRSLYNGLDMIREMSAAGESARSEVSLIETLERALACLHSGAQYSQDAPNVASMSDYEAFKHWGARLKESLPLEESASGAGPLASQALLSQATEFCSNQMIGIDYGNAALAAVDDHNIFDSFVPSFETPILSAENLSSSAWPTWTEAQVLEHFLTEDN